MRRFRMRRLLPRFSLRTVVISVTVACCYLSAWQHTKSSASNISLEGWGRSVAGCPAPFVLGIYEPISLTPPPDSPAAKVPSEYHANAGISWTPSPQVRYHICGFGWVIPTRFVRQSRRVTYNDDGEVSSWLFMVRPRIIIAEEDDEPALGSSPQGVGHGF